MENTMRRMGLARALLIFATILLCGPARAQYLHTNGTALADGSGNAIQLRGVDLGNWLYAEAYMVDAPFADYYGEDGTTDTYQQAIVNLVGTANAATFWSKYRSAYITEPDIAEIHEQGFNCVRVPLDFRLFYDPSSGTYLTSNYVYLDNLLTWCAANDVYAILDMHNMPGGKNIGVADSIFVNTSYQTILTTIWKSIAARYATNTALAGYDLINEPTVDGSSVLRTLYIALTSAIRKVDTHHTIFVEGDYSASQLGVLGAPWDSNLCYSDHNYWDTLPNNLPTHENLATANDVPLWMGEFGVNSNTWNGQQVAYLNQVNSLNGREIQASWCCWAWKASAIWSAIDIKLPLEYLLILAYWDGYTSQPSATNAYNYLLSLVTAVTYANCALNKDVTDALLRPSFLTATVPYASLAIPGTIPAVQYDMGAEGVAYYNTFYEITTGSLAAWNKGWVYRNDGVDITSTTDSGVGDVVYSIVNGEWLGYTVTCKPGTYNVLIRYSGPGGQLHLTLNGVNITGTVTLPASPNSGSTSSYTTVTVPNVQITASGSSKLQLCFDVAGYNINWVEFEAAR
jgi:aryl-phospho-beta-D-glucosidase BglC (GH1 family)